MADTSSIAVVIVTWNSAATIERCLQSCSGLSVTVVDNASTDDSVRRVRLFRSVDVVENTANRGFAAAANQGIARSRAQYILLLNPDVELTTPIELLVDACRNGAVIATGRLVEPGGGTQRGFTLRRLPQPATLVLEVLGLNRLLPSNSVNRRYRCLDISLDKECDAEQPAGAFLFFSKDLWSQLGGFDERFFPVWFEDVDFCKRALERGRIRYIPSVIAKHQGGASIARMDWAHREVCWYGSLLKYASKHFSPRQFRGICGAVVLASTLRMPLALFKQRTMHAIAVYAKTASLAGRGLASGSFGSPARNEEHQQGSRVRTIPNTTD